MLSLVRPRVNRAVDVVLPTVYVLSIVASCLGETWVHHLLGSAVEVALLLALAVTAWRWPRG